VQFQLKEYHHPDFSSSQFVSAPDATMVPASLDGVAPENYHATTIFPEYFKVGGQWLLAQESRMDSTAVYEDGSIVTCEFRNLKKGDLVVVGREEDGSEGIYVHTNGFDDAQGGNGDSFAFRQGRSRETAFSMDYDMLYEQLRFEKDNGYIVWVLGPACAFDADSRKAFSRLCEHGYVHALLAGNALAVHDLEASYKKSALGQDIYTQLSQPHGHYNHLDTINRVRETGSIPAFIEQENIQDGIMYECVKHDIPFVLTGSIRDDGPLPEVYADAYAGQNAMRAHIRKATTIIGMATTLHSIAAGNIAPSFRVMPDGTIRQLYYYMVDISEFAANKLGDRGSLSARSIITNVQDFVVQTSKNLVSVQ
jgi:lysine-ketoglutarate reductase/saccharopine dehydrogenase-like protein (TIGR00300 family)